MPNITRYFHRKSVAVGLCAALATLLLLGGGSWLLLRHERDGTLLQAEGDLQKNAAEAAGTIGRTLGTLDLVVSLVLDDYRAGRLDLEGVANRLQDRVADAPERLPGLAVYAVLNAEGTILHGNNGKSIGVNFAWRDYFQVHARNEVDGSFIAAPIIGTVAPHRRIVVQSWALRDAVGGFEGIVMAITTWRHHGEMLLTARGRLGDHALIVDRDGEVYAADADNWPPDRREPPRGPVLDALLLSETAAGRRLDVGGEDWLAVTAGVPGTSLEVLTAARASTVLSRWYHIVWAAALVAALAALVVGLLAACLHRAIDEARRAQGRAEAGERAKERFLATMSHEIRTPMTAVLGMVDLLGDKPLPDDAHDNVAAIRRAGEQLLAIINDILDFMKLDDGAFVPAENDFELFAAIEDVQSIVRPQATGRGLGFAIDRDDSGPLYLKGDPRRIKQVLFNLVGNAIKFTLSGQITLRVRQRDGAGDGRIVVRVEVEDTGVGFDPAEAPGLFDVFAQAERTTRQAVGGTGLGLAISKGLVERMGGTIGCASTPGAGSSFWFEIPFLPGEPCATREEETAAAVPARALRILVAEDATLNQDLITELLTRAGHAPTMTSNGAELLSLAAEEAYDLLILDIGMPILDGEAAIRRLRAGAGANRATPAIALTANVMETDRKRYLKAGFDACACKPIERRQLFETIERLTARRIPAPEPSRPSPQAPPRGVEDADLAIDAGFLNRMYEEMPRDKVDAWLRRALEEADKALIGLEDADTDPIEAARAAHRLKGTAANFGLRAVSEAAEAIETAGGARSPSTLGTLRDAIARTRDVLEVERFEAPQRCEA